jgi:hypothetical protein
MPLQVTSSGRHDRVELSISYAEVEAAQATTPSERARCEQVGIARSTFRDERGRRERLQQEDPALAMMTSTPEGQQLLERIVIAAHLVITMLGSQGVEMVCLFLRLAGFGGSWACRMAPNMG